MYAADAPKPPKSWTDLGPFLGGIKGSTSDLKWAATGDLKVAVDDLFTELFGSKEAAAKARAEAAAASKPKKVCTVWEQ